MDLEVELHVRNEEECSLEVFSSRKEERSEILPLLYKISAAFNHVKTAEGIISTSPLDKARSQG